MSLKQQLLLFAASLGAGFIFGVFYDLYRVINRRFGFGPWFTQVGDLAAWVFLGGSIFLMLQYTSAGEFRGFVLIGIMLGVLAYRGSIRRWAVRLLWVIVGAIARASEIVWRFISWPFRVFYRVIDHLLFWWMRALAAGIRKQIFRFKQKNS